MDYSRKFQQPESPTAFGGDEPIDELPRREILEFAAMDSVRDASKSNISSFFCFLLTFSRDENTWDIVKDSIFAETRVCAFFFDDHNEFGIACNPQTTRLQTRYTPTELDTALPFIVG